jgi:hypothetical protein
MVSLTILATASAENPVSGFPEVAVAAGKRARLGEGVFILDLFLESKELARIGSASSALRPISTALDFASFWIRSGYSGCPGLSGTL